MKGLLLNSFNKLKSKQNIIKLISFAVVSVSAIIVSLYISGVTVAYNVKYGNATVGQVEDKTEFEKAKAIAASFVNTANAANYMYTPEYTVVLSLKSRNTSQESIADAILSNTAEFSKSAVIKVNGNIVATGADYNAFKDLLNTRLSSYNIENYECNSEFTDTVELTTEYCSVNEYSSADDVSAVIENLSVKTTVKETADIKLSYKTITNKSSAYSVGYYAVTTNGSEGLKHTVNNVVYLNGEEISRETAEDVIVSQPVNQVVTVGTAPSYGSGNGSLLFPLSKATYKYISSPFGDMQDRSKPHKGVDFAANRGTPIYAADDGTVVEACYNNSGYGYVVTIDHGNGMKTRYAHNSQNLVSVGQTVAKGQTIALVGSTGQSTGYHLHFEVQINGVVVNPMIYIG